jgi:hypothetical protein
MSNKAWRSKSVSDRVSAKGLRLSGGHPPMRASPHSSQQLPSNLTHELEQGMLEQRQLQLQQQQKGQEQVGSGKTPPHATEQRQEMRECHLPPPVALLAPPLSPIPANVREYFVLRKRNT